MAVPFQDGFSQFFDDSGDPLSGGLVYTYSAGTTSGQVTYINQSGTVEHSNPIVLDAAGRVSIWLDRGVGYRFDIRSADEVLIESVDNIVISTDDFIDSSDVPYAPGWVDSVPSTVMAKLGEWVSLKDFGAAFDGTDESDILRAAYARLKLAGGGVLLVNGAMSIGSTVRVPSNIRHIGTGWDVSGFWVHSTLPLQSPMLYNETGDPGFGLRTDKNISFEGMTFDGDARVFPVYDQDTNPPTYDGLSQSASRGHMVRMYSVENFQMIRCEVRNHRSNAAVVDCGGMDSLHFGNSYHDNGKIDDISPCIFLGPRSASSTFPVRARVIGNSFYDCDRMALRFESDGGLIANNTAENLGEGFCHVDGGKDTTIVGNVVRDIRVADIVANGVEIESWVGDSGGIIVTGNVFERCGTRGISVNGGRQITITANHFIDCGNDAVYPAINGPLNYERGRAAGDPIDAVKRAGIGITTADEYQVDGLVIKDNIITNSLGSAGTQYGVVWGKTGTPTYLHINQISTDNIINGMHLDRYFVTEDAMGSNIVIDDRNLDDLTSETDLIQLSNGYVVSADAATPMLTTNIGTNKARALEFGASIATTPQVESWQWTIGPPSNWPGGTVVGVVVWFVKKISAASGNVQLQVAGTQRNTATNLGGGALASETFTEAVEANPGATLEKHVLTLATPWAFGDDSSFIFRMSRDVTDALDTYDHSIYVASIQLQLRKDPEGY